MRALCVVIPSEKRLETTPIRPMGIPKNLRDTTLRMKRYNRIKQSGQEPKPARTLCGEIGVLVSILQATAAGNLFMECFRITIIAYATAAGNFYI